VARVATRTHCCPLECLLSLSTAHTLEGSHYHLPSTGPRNISPRQGGTWHCLSLTLAFLDTDPSVLLLSSLCLSPEGFPTTVSVRSSTHLPTAEISYAFLFFCGAVGWNPSFCTCILPLSYIPNPKFLTTIHGASWSQRCVPGSHCPSASSESESGTSRTLAQTAFMSIRKKLPPGLQSWPMEIINHSRFPETFHVSLSGPLGPDPTNLSSSIYETFYRIL
jgi:hypothetical protein